MGGLEEGELTLLSINYFRSSRIFENYFGVNRQPSACLTGYDDFVDYDAI